MSFQVLSWVWFAMFIAGLIFAKRSPEGFPHPMTYAALILSNIWQVADHFQKIITPLH